MKYQIRKCEQYTVWQSSEVIELDPEYFKTLSENPYNGSSEEEFLKYIEEYLVSCRNEGFPEELDSSIADQLNKLIENIEWTEYHNSCWKGENSWMEIGENTSKDIFITHYHTSN